MSFLQDCFGGFKLGTQEGSINFKKISKCGKKLNWKYEIMASTFKVHYEICANGT